MRIWFRWPIDHGRNPSPTYHRSEQDLPSVSQFSLHPAFRKLVSQLQTLFFLKAIDPFRGGQPTFALKQDVEASIIVTHTRRTNISELERQIGLFVTSRLVYIAILQLGA